MRQLMNIFCDFDGTIAACDVTDALLETFAAATWREVEADWRAGRIGSLECMRSQVALLRCTRDEMNECLDMVVIDPGFVDFVAACRDTGVPVAVVSDGIDYAIQRIMARHGLEDLPVYANHLRAVPNGGWALEFPHANPRCHSQSGTCKCALLRTLATPKAKTVLIGDGMSDVCAAAHAADFVLAKEGLLRFCRHNGLPHAAYSGFAAAARLLDLEKRPRDEAGRTMPHDALVPISA